MKNKVLLWSLAAVMTLPAITSCNSDYLDEKPRTTYTSDEATQSEAGAEAAITGLSRQMQRQFGDLKNGNLNASGETFFANLYGEGLSADANIGEITRYASGACNPTAFRNLQGWWAAWMYEYAYSIIRSANNILGAMPETNLTDSQYWMKGCALTMRSHAYFRIMQVYAPRWADSKNGEAYCIVLRVKPNEPNDKELSTCNQVYDQLYGDLNTAIDCFSKTTKKRGDNLYYPDETVAKGVLARVALLKDDYVTAQKMAHDARASYKIMTADEYLDGFSTVNDEWMWAPAMDPLGIYFWNFGSHYACNGHYVESWGYTCSMDYNLYRELKETDVRARLYFGPLCIKFAPELAKEYGIVESDFYKNSNLTQTSQRVSLTGTGANVKGKKKDFWNFIIAYGETFADLRPKTDLPVYPTNKYGFSLGTQYKFQGIDDGYTSCWIPYMRASEMLLIEAEAAYQNNDETTALNCLAELMAKRDKTYSFSGRGIALLDEIKLQRRIELWGEGFNWFDVKRWNQVLERKAWDSNNLNQCGGWPKTLAREFQPDFMYGWVAALPMSEFTYNKKADASLLGL